MVGYLETPSGESIKIEGEVAKYIEQIQQENSELRRERSKLKLELIFGTTKHKKKWWHSLIPQ